ncbi:MAG: hypothetical protein AB4352_26260 [Hormoscilla sp.]
MWPTRVVHDFIEAPGIAGSTVALPHLLANYSPPGRSLWRRLYLLTSRGNMQALVAIGRI